MIFYVTQYCLKSFAYSFNEVISERKVENSQKRKEEIHENEDFESTNIMIVFEELFTLEH